MDCRNYGTSIIMAAQDFYTLNEAQKSEIFTATAQQKGLPDYAVEKDCEVL